MPTKTTISPKQLAQVCDYLNADRREHQAAHGNWNLDTGKLITALEQAGIIDDHLKLVTAERKVLAEFVNDVNITGGYFRDHKGRPRPMADPTWVDIASTFLDACAVLGVKPIEGLAADAPEY